MGIVIIARTVKMRNDLWTQEQVEMLKFGRAIGLSARQISKRLVSKTRNAVIGKLHRLGILRKTDENQRYFKKFKSKVLPTNGTGGGVTLLELTHEHCRWPLDDKTSCGAKMQKEIRQFPYCHEHTDLAMAPLNPNRKRDQFYQWKHGQR